MWGEYDLETMFLLRREKNCYAVAAAVNTADAVVAAPALSNETTNALDSSSHPLSNDHRAYGFEGRIVRID